jgi:hypothetical protein
MACIIALDRSICHCVHYYSVFVDSMPMLIYNPTPTALEIDATVPSCLGSRVMNASGVLCEVRLFPIREAYRRG